MTAARVSLPHSVADRLHLHPTSRRRFSAAPLLTLLLAVFALATQAHAQVTYTVDTLADTNTGVGNTGSLRYVIGQVNKGSGGDTINFSGAGATGTITLTSALPAIAESVTITGPGANVLTVSGNNAVTVFTINSGVTVSLSGLTIANGIGTAGGGINNSGTLTVSNCTFSGNTVSSWGGGINNGGTLTVSNSTFSGNTTGNGGGGIANSGTLTVNNSTLYANTASGDGGGILNGSGTLTVSNSTFSENSAGNGGGGIYVYSGTVTMTNSIVAGNTDNGSGQTGNDCYGCTLSGTNLISTSSSSPSPMLGPLQYNGGPTETMMPLTGSPARQPSAAIQ
jgi:predicted outer membrane repeat protein